MVAGLLPALILAQFLHLEGPCRSSFGTLDISRDLLYTANRQGVDLSLRGESTGPLRFNRNLHAVHLIAFLVR